MRQFYHPDFGIKTIRGETAHHILNVLRKKKGDVIRIFDGNGKNAQAEITEANRKKSEIKIKISQIQKIPEPQMEINLYLAALKPKPFLLAVEKTVELGVTRIIPLRTKRSERREIKLERVKKTAIAACQQSGRNFLPSLDETKDFLVGIMDWKRDGSEGFILLAASPPLAISRLPRKISFFVGPAGGFAEDEIREAKKAGLIAASISKNILRSETAAIAACARVAGG